MSRPRERETNYPRRLQIRFNPDLTELIPAEQLDADFGGEHPYEFEPEGYWSQIVEYVQCLERSSVYRFNQQLRSPLRTGIVE